MKLHTKKKLAIPKDKYITPIRHYIDENGNWMIDFNKEDIKKLIKKFKFKKKK